MSNEQIQEILDEVVRSARSVRILTDRDETILRPSQWDITWDGEYLSFRFKGTQDTYRWKTADIQTIEYLGGNDD